MPNAFTQASRDERLSIGLGNFIDKLRAPDGIAALLVRAKPLTIPNSDFVLKAILDQHLMAAIMRGDYREVHGTLVTIFGAEVTTGTAHYRQGSPIENGTNGAQIKGAKL